MTCGPEMGTEELWGAACQAVSLPCPLCPGSWAGLACRRGWRDLVRESTCFRPRHCEPVGGSSTSPGGTHPSPS